MSSIGYPQLNYFLFKDNAKFNKIISCNDINMNKEYFNSKLMTPVSRSIPNADYDKMEIQTSQKEYPADIQIDEKYSGTELLPLKDQELNFKNMEHVTMNRARLYDWFMDVCRVYLQSWRTLWAAIKIMDILIVQKGGIQVQNIHLYGITSLYMASQYHQSTNKLTKKQVIKSIVYNKFTMMQFERCRDQIFNFMCVQGSRSMEFPTMVDRLTDEFIFLSEQKMKKILIQLFYVHQLPLKAYPHFKGWSLNLTEKQLVRDVCQTVLSEQRWKDCWQVEDQLLTKYGCLNARRYGMKLNL